MESLQHAGWEPSPPSKEIMSPAAIKTCTQLDLLIAAHGGGRDIFSHRYAPSPTNSHWLQKCKIGLWCWGLLLFFAFLPYSQALLSLLSSPIVVSQPLLAPLFSRLVWNLGKSGKIFKSNFQSSLILWRGWLQRYSISEVFKLWELWLVVSS